MFILGINAYHGDSSACLVRDGKLISAAEEERFRRIKHWAGFPSEAICYCLSEAGIGLGDVDHFAINRDPKANLLKKLGFTLSKRPDLKFVLDRLRNAKQVATLSEELEHAFPGETMRGTVHYVEHHLAHLASAFLVSPFKEAVAVSVDGFGDFASAAWGVGRGNVVEVDEKVYFPHSLGIYYQTLTQHLGFPQYGDEYKVMGLAPYGKPCYLNEMQQIVLLQEDGSFRLNLDYFRHAHERVESEWYNGAPTVGRLFTPALEALLGPARQQGEELTQRHKDMARSIQAMYEKAFFHLLNALHRRYQLDAVALAGGCAMNSVANGKIYANTPFRRVYVQSAAGDAGGAIGAAFAAWQDVGGGKRTFVMDHAFWGPHFTDEQIEALLTVRTDELNAQGCKIEHLASLQDISARAAQAIAEGKVVGWFQGRMEWGPRALGNRSILGDPRRADMKDILNLKIKRRESFRPFAPSILREAVCDWFETDDDVPFMMQVFNILAPKRAQIPAVTHVDGSGRLQTVSRDTNPAYYNLIEAFKALTGVPIVLNTSFNENEPLVCKPDEALDCFLRTKMDVLVLGNWVLERKDWVLK